MKQRILTGLLLVIGFGSVIYFGGIVFRSMLVAILMIGAYELYRVNKKKWPKTILFIMIAYIYLVTTQRPGHIMVILSLYLIVLFTISIFYEWFTTYDVSYVFMTTTLLGLAIHAVIQISMIDGDTSRLPIIYIVAVTLFGTDTGAYFGGYFFGKHKLIERISPNKTIEGAIAGYIVGAIVAFSIGFMVMIPYLGYSVPFVVAVSLLMPVVGQIGDLAFSSIKRFYGIKDFGFIFPGHGGVLDRIDSVLFNVLLYSSLLILLGS